MLQVVPVAASQVLGRDFLGSLLTHKWRLTSQQREATLDRKAKADPVNSLAVRLMNQEAAGTHATIGIPSWLFRGMGGFDLEVPTGEDLWQRTLMMDASLQPQVITDQNASGFDLAARPQTISAEICALSDRRCGQGRVVRNQKSGFSPMPKPVLVVLDEVKDTDGEVTMLLKPEGDRHVCGEILTMEELTSELLVIHGVDWLEALNKEWHLPEVGPCTDSQSQWKPDLGVNTLPGCLEFL